MQAYLLTIVSKFGGHPAICLREAIFVPAQKCPYHVTFDLDLEHTLDARWPGVHRVQVWWWSGHLPARSDCSARIDYIVTCYIVAWQTYRETDCITSLPLAGEVIKTTHSNTARDILCYHGLTSALSFPLVSLKLICLVLLPSSSSNYLKTVSNR